MKNRIAPKAIVLAALSLAPLTGQQHLEYAVIMTRHGVRSPTWDQARLNAYSTSPWPAWPVPPGHLTPHGRSAIALLGSYYREQFLAENLLESRRCSDAGRMYFWADTDQRTVETSRALAETLAPGCEAPTHSLAEGEKDPIFSGASDYDARLASEAVRTRIGADPKQIVLMHKAEFETLQAVLDGARSKATKRLGVPLELGVSSRGDTVELQGPLSVSSTLSEDFLLEYAEGMRGDDLGWGRLTKENLLSVLGLHGLYADIMRRTPYLARTRGSNLLLHILRSLEQAQSGKSTPDAIGNPGDKLLVLSGHDTNLSNLSGMLGLSWKVGAYQQDETPPGAALIFRLWRGKAGYAVSVEFVAESLDQMRNLTALTIAAPPLHQAVLIPGCQEGRCEWNAFRVILDKAIDSRFAN